jgi:hypothetical protein
MCGGSDVLVGYLVVETRHQLFISELSSSPALNKWGFSVRKSIASV